MYVGSAGLMTSMVRKTREEQNGLMGACSVCAGAVLSMGLGKIASKMLNGMIDKIVDFWDDVKPNKKKESADEEEKADG